MPFSIIKVSAAYEDFLWDYYSDHPSIGFASYNTQFQHLMKQRFGWADHHVRSLREKGYTAHELVPNALPLQRAWAKEHGVPLQGADLVLSQIAHYSPEVVFLQCNNAFTAEWCRNLRKTVPSIKLLMGWICSPFTGKDVERFREFDLMLTCIPSIVESLQALGIETAILNHGFDDTVLNEIKNDISSPDIPVLFSGSLIQAKDYHYGRLEFLKSVIEADVPIEIASEITSAKKLVAKKCLGAAASLFERMAPAQVFHSSTRFTRALQWKEIRFFDSLRLQFALRKNLRKSVYGLELFQEMQRAQITLNYHIDFAGDFAGNSRLFEATGMGSCLLTDHKKNILDFFDPGKEVMTFSGVEDCIEKIKWLLSHPVEREKIAKAGQERCLKDHSFKRRTEQLISLVEQRL